MTRNTITKARVIYVFEQEKRYLPTEKLAKKEATQGRDYVITYSYMHFFISPDKDFMKFSTGDGWCTHFKDFYEAKKCLTEYRKEIKEAAVRAYGSEFDKTDLNITVDYLVYYDTVTKTSVFNKEETKKWGKNLVFIKLNCARSPEHPNSRYQWYTVTPEEESVLFEVYSLEVDENDIPHFVPSKVNPCFRVYKNNQNKHCKAFGVLYNERKRCYQDIESNPLYAESKIFNRYGSYDETYGLQQAYDITGGHGCDRNNDFNEETLAILKDFGMPDYIFSGYGFNPSKVDDISGFVAAMIDYEKPCSTSETMICQEISNFLKDIPFDEEHSVVKYKNGYILRLGRINQVYKIIEERGYDHRIYERIYDHKSTSEDIKSCELMYEEYNEFARLFISNTFTTRSLSMAQNGGRTWRHDGIHLVDNLFESNPEETNLGIDVEASNRKTLEKLYTVHPKLKYMKKYMEKHPDVLYNACVPFLRALFQYDMILETMIALGKDDIFWAPAGSHSNRYYGYRSSRGTYKQTVEEFSMEKFITSFGLRNIKQTGDFYQRMGLTKQQFKLLMEDPEESCKIMDVINELRFRIPNSERIIRISHYGYTEDRSLLKLVSYEDFRLAIEIAKDFLKRNDYTYGIGNDVNNLLQNYGNYKRVYKAVCERDYSIEILKDYLQMRKRLEDEQFPEYKASIWDMFPDNNEELQRYHDRIILLDQECSALKDVRIRVSYLGNYTKTEFYLKLKEAGVLATDFNSIVQQLYTTCDYSASTLHMSDIITKLPESLEEFEQQKEQVEAVATTYANLWSMYYGSECRTRYPGEYTKRHARENWGMEYTEFVVTQLGAGLDLDKYDLYLRLRRKFIESNTGFDASNYPVRLPDNDTMIGLYQDLAAKEPELDELIRRREQEIRDRMRREQESKVAAQNEKYADRYKKLKKFNFSPEGDERCIIVPKNLVNLVVEGQTLHHCVGSYVDAVSEGKNTIVFLRKTEDADTPYVTVSLLHNGKAWYIDQAHGDHNSDISDEDVEFLKSWAKSKDILLESVKKHYGMYCHN